MILCLDVGNTQVYGGVFNEGILITQFRRTSQLQSSSDELGVFFRSVLRENDVTPQPFSKSLFVAWSRTFCIPFAPARKNTLKLSRLSCGLGSKRA